MDFKSLIQDIRGKKFKPVYLLHGEEPYYIDVITKEFQANVLEPHEKDFNETIFYGKEINVLQLISEAKGFPMMAERRLVIVKEAQEMKDIDVFESYLNQPNPSTIVVFAHKHKKIDARKKIAKLFPKVGEVFLSDRVRDYQLVDWITKYMATTDYKITGKAAIMLADFLGNDLSRITSELDKLALLIEKGSTINEVHIEENIGISKDYNVFELSKAVSSNNFEKAMKIVLYFHHNPKTGPLVVVISTLFNLFSQLMKINFAPNKSPDALASLLGVAPFITKDLIVAARVYDKKKIASNISVLYEYDLKSKGINSASYEEYDLMVEMIYKLMH